MKALLNFTKANINSFKKYLLVLTLCSFFYILSFFFPKNISGDNLIRLYFLDVGQGDSIYITMPDDRTMLVDGGPDSAVVSELDKINPYWDRSIDYLFLTHPHTDHMLGLFDILNSYEVGEIFVNNQNFQSTEFNLLLKMVQELQKQVKTFEKGDTLIFSDVSIRCLWPDDNSYTTDNINNTSMVHHIKYKEFDLLLTGDIEDDVQPLISWPENVEIIKIPHHGATNGLWQNLLSISKPYVAVISVGENDFGHPSPEVLDFLESIGTKTYRTDTEGTIVIASDGKRWWVED